MGVGGQCKNKPMLVKIELYFAEIIGCSRATRCLGLCLHNKVFYWHSWAHLGANFLQRAAFEEYVVPLVKTIPQNIVLCGTFSKDASEKLLAFDVVFEHTLSCALCDAGGASRAGSMGIP